MLRYRALPSKERGRGWFDRMSSGLEDDGERSSGPSGEVGHTLLYFASCADVFFHNYEIGIGHCRDGGGNLALLGESGGLDDDAVKLKAVRTQQMPGIARRYE